MQKKAQRVSRKLNAIDQHQKKTDTKCRIAVKDREASAMIAMKLSGFNEDDIACTMNREEGVIVEKMRGFDGLFAWVERTKDEANLYRRNRSEILSAAEGVLLKSLLDENTVERANLRDRAYAFREIYHACRLAEGKSTSNVEHIHFTMPENFSEVVETPLKPMPDK